MSELKKNRQLFYSQLEKMFAGKELKNFKGKSGFSNLLIIKAKYFKAIQDELEKVISAKFPTANLSGWKIKQRFKDRCIFLDGGNEIKVKEDELYFSEYPFLRDLIWWKA